METGKGGIAAMPQGEHERDARIVHHNFCAAATKLRRHPLLATSSDFADFAAQLAAVSAMQIKLGARIDQIEAENHGA
jgi:hypothetical protein